ncbi:hypothetical protein TSUD_301160 [Trifolium subterraneum]|uniref:Transposase Tnp1/En/Spm-like domain-containing protein n=1 Tax=Trifolium subterraneum TaxID=3900 RepID=A0A2Z6NRE4_TRISU|nr:hypothetical protein TSUD_301160 [Trifolium subterraneum]
MAKRRFQPMNEPTPATNQLNHSAHTSTDGPTTATNQPITDAAMAQVLSLRSCFVLGARISMAKRRFQPMNEPTPATNQPSQSAHTSTDGPTPATNQPSHSAHASTDGPTPATSQPVSPPHPEPENDESTLAINNAANKSKKKSVKYWTVDVKDARGVVNEVRLRSQDVFSLPPGKKILMEWSEIGQPVGEDAGLLGSFLGKVGADFSKFPISYERWPDVPGEYKERVWIDTIMKKWDVYDEIHKKYIYGIIGKRWRDNRKLAFDNCYDPSVSWEQSLDRRPKGINKEQWATFLTYRLKPENLEKASKNAANRAKQTTPHTLGTMTAARFKHRLELDDERKYTRGDIYAISHKRNDGTFINEEAQKKSEELETHRQGNSSVSDDAYTAVFGKEHPGHVRGVGFGVVPSQYFGRSSRAPTSASGGNDSTMRQELNASNARIRALEDQVVMLTQQYALYSRGTQVSNTDAPTGGRPSSASHETLD